MSPISYSPFVLYLASLLPEGLHQLRHVLGVLLVYPGQLVAEVRDWDTQSRQGQQQGSHLV